MTSHDTELTNYEPSHEPHRKPMNHMGPHEAHDNSRQQHHEHQRDLILNPHRPVDADPSGIRICR